MRSIAKNSDFRVSKADDRAKGEDHPQHTHAKAVIKTDCLKLNKDYMKKFPQYDSYSSRESIVKCSSRMGNPQKPSPPLKSLQEVNPYQQTHITKEQPTN